MPIKADIYWIPGLRSGRLAIMPRPRAGDWIDDELTAWKTAGIDVVVSLLTHGEVLELSLQEEPSICNRLGIEFISYPIPDMQVPASIPATIALIKDIDNRLKAGKAVAIHCRGGIGRSGLVASCVLVWSGETIENAFERISNARGLPVPETDEQRRWVKRLLVNPES